MAIHFKSLLKPRNYQTVMNPTLGTTWLSLKNITQWNYEKNMKILRLE